MINKDTRELFIYTEFGPSWADMVDAPLVQNMLTELGSGDINIRINSYGGSVDEALAIISMLQRHDGAVNVTIDSIAASAASLFGAAFGAKIAPHARVMIHNPLMMTYGNIQEHEKNIRALTSYTDSLLVYYQSAMKEKTKDEIQSLLNAETWYTAQAAVDVGLATELVEVKEPVQARTPKAVSFKNPLPFDPQEKPKQRDYLYDPDRIAAELKLKLLTT